MKGIRKKTAALLALVFTFLSIPVIPVSAEESQLALRIDRMELSPEEVANLTPYGGFDAKIQKAQEDIAAIQQEIGSGTLSEKEIDKKQNDIRQKQASIASWQEEMNKPENQRVVPVNIQISGNENGFLASEFGITYDGRLKLRDVDKNLIGDSFQYVCNENEHTIWFSGASAMGSEVASRDKVTVMTLYFQIPEQYNVNDQYAINFNWEGHGKSASWYSEQKVNEIDTLKSNSHNGQIWLPSSDSARLSQQELQLNQGETFQLEVLTASGSCYWFSGNNDIATVSADGLVTALKPGVATIYCISAATGQVLTCEVTVTTYYYYVLKDNDTTPITIHSPSQVVYLEYPLASSDVLWYSSNPSVVTVDEKNGRVRGVSQGRAVVTAMCNGRAMMKSIIVDFGSENQNPTETQPEDPQPDTLPTEPQPTEPEILPTVEETTEPTQPPVTEPEPTTPPETIPPIVNSTGDIDGNDTIDIVDVIYLNQILVGIAQSDGVSTEIADVYLDGVLDDKDAMTLLKHLVKIVPVIPVNP